MTEPGMAQDSPMLRPSVMSLAIKDRAGLYAAYMPFLEHGGIFIPGARPAQLGDEVFVLLTLMQDDYRYPVAGKVAWITPPGSTRTAGIGVQFPDDETGIRVRRRIEELLGTALGSSRPTHTV